ncbi:uncharacterized protein BX663DRAFT_67068 [Cokeromyces recurvatus]|uniref:uncharacterized protein n=1 Tax=Cokeromyces recurvatus TaxID=90255 RepID=UPI00221F545A|nr:uncharacterized protein BX663DRAFT_67068 [Cokeromyces recurvatus]KAI7902706.1 hypothetical protein BX663DRAFT_67068 [Cokeromyces recurvatus]
MIMMAPFTSTNNNTTSTTMNSSTTTASKGKKPYKSWLKDGVNGGPCSMDILINWLSKKTNYAKWKGDDCERIPKKSLLESIIDEMRVAGIYHRLAKDVASKISTLQSNYRLAREWKEVDGKKLLETGISEESIHDELLKRFPYWDALHEVFGSNKNTAAWPMSISNIMHSKEETIHDSFRIKRESYDFNDTETTFESSTKCKRRRLSDSSVQLNTRCSIDNSSDSASTTYSTQSLPTIQPPPPPPPLPPPPPPPITVTTTTESSSTPSLFRSLPRVLPSPILNSTIPLQQHHTTTSSSISNQTPNLLNTTLDRREQVLADSLLQMAREKEAGRMKRSQDMLQFLREKRIERDQLLIEKEITKRVKAKAELVKNLMEAGFDKDAIAKQLKSK